MISDNDHYENEWELGIEAKAEYEYDMSISAEAEAQAEIDVLKEFDMTDNKFGVVVRALIRYLNKEGKPRSFENRLWRIRYYFHYHANKEPMTYGEWRRFMRNCGYNHEQIFTGYGHPIRWYRQVFSKKHIARTVDIAYRGLNDNNISCS